MRHLSESPRRLPDCRRGLTRLSGSSRAWALGLISTVAALTGTLGCSSSVVVVERIAAPRAAAYVDEKLKPEVLLRGETAMPIPSGATLSPTGIAIAANESIKLSDHDTVVVDEANTVVRLESQGSAPRTFAAGTARLVGDEVRVSDPAPRTWATFQPNDVVELRGTFETGDTTPTGGHIDGKRNFGLMLVGGLLFAGAYAPSVAVGASSDVKGDRMLVLPLVGPWIDLATRDKCNPNDPSEQTITPCQSESFNNAILITAGVTQLVGAGFFAAGLWMRPRYNRELQPTARLMPRVSPRSLGLSVNGEF